MAISATLFDTRVDDVRVSDTELIVRLRDGRQIRAPLAWFPRLAAEGEKERSTWVLAAAGHGIHWPLIDEDLSVEGLLRTDSGR